MREKIDVCEGCETIQPDPIEVPQVDTHPWPPLTKKTRKFSLHQFPSSFQGKPRIWGYLSHTFNNIQSQYGGLTYILTGMVNITTDVFGQVWFEDLQRCCKSSVLISKVPAAIGAYIRYMHTSSICIFSLSLAYIRVQYKVFIALCEASQGSNSTNDLAILNPHYYDRYH